MRAGPRPSRLPAVGQLTLVERTAACSLPDDASCALRACGRGLRTPPRGSAAPTSSEAGVAPLCLLSPRGEKFLGVGPPPVAQARAPDAAPFAYLGLRPEPTCPAPAPGLCRLHPAPAMSGQSAAGPEARLRLRPTPVSEPRQSEATRAPARGAGAAGEEGCPEASATRTVTGRPYGTGLGG